MSLRVSVLVSISLFVILIILSRMLKEPESNNSAVPREEMGLEETGLDEEDYRQLKEQEAQEALHQEKIREGYKAVYTQCLSEGNDLFREEYDARGHSRKVLFEDEKSVRFIIYDRDSANNSCALYVYYESKKDSAGSWSWLEASILGFYAYEYEKGIVVDGQKTAWEDPAAQEYRDITGE